MTGRITRIFLAIIVLLLSPALLCDALIAPAASFHWIRPFQFRVYDHTLISSETSYVLPHNSLTLTAGDLGIVEFDQENHLQHLGDWNAVIRAMSDHRPIWFKVDYIAEDQD
jgi:hypothetical protein